MFTIIDNKPYYIGKDNKIFPCTVREGGYIVDFEQGKVIRGAIKKYSLIEIYAKLGNNVSSIEVKEETQAEEKKTSKKKSK